MEKRRRKRARETFEEMGRQISKRGRKAARTLARTPELIALERKERALKHELDHQLRQVGLQALRMHKRALRQRGGVSPFAGVGPIIEGLETADELQDEIQSNRKRISKVKVEMRHER